MAHAPPRARAACDPCARVHARGCACREQTFDELRRIFGRHGFEAGKWGAFKSCCASLLVRPAHVRHWPLQLYRDMLAYSLDARNTYHASLAVSHHAWELWAGRDVGAADLMTYYEVDLKLSKMRGCPAWATVGSSSSSGGSRERAALGGEEGAG